MSELLDATQPEVVLPISGIKVTFRGLKGRDYIEAEKACRDRTSEKEYGLALLSRKCFFNGRQAVVDDILDLDEEDISALVAGVPVPLSRGSHPTP